MEKKYQVLSLKREKITEILMTLVLLLPDIYSKVNKLFDNTKIIDQTIMFGKDNIL